MESPSPARAVAGADNGCQRPGDVVHEGEQNGAGVKQRSTFGGWRAECEDRGPGNGKNNRGADTDDEGWKPSSCDRSNRNPDERRQRKERYGDTRNGTERQRGS